MCVWGGGGGGGGKLHKLLVCLSCNFCIFNNCSLTFKNTIYMCYCVSTVMWLMFSHVLISLM